MFKKKLNLIFFLCVFAVTFTVYILTLAPSVYLEDSGELIASAYSLGVAHPPGYPLYVLLGKWFSLLPFGEVAYRINLMSAFFGAATCAVLFLMIQEIFISIKDRSEFTESIKAQKTQKAKKYNLNDIILFYIVPASCSLILAFSRTFWSQSVIAEVYTLNSFLLAVIMWLLLLWYEARRDEAMPRLDNKYLLWAAFLFGLSLTNHQMMLMCTPAFGLFALMVDKKIWKKWKLILAVLGLSMLGFIVYAWLPVSANLVKADFIWGDPYNWQNFKAHVFRQQYGDFAKFTWQGFFNQSKLIYVNSLFDICLSEFTVLGVVLVLVGFIYLWFREKKIWLWLVLIFIGNTFLIIILRQMEFTFMNDLMFQVYYLPSFMVLTIFISVAFYWLISRLLKILEDFQPLMKSILRTLLVIILTCIPIAYLFNNYSLNDQSDFRLVDEYSKNVLLSLKPNAKLLLFSDQPALDSVTFSLMYQQVVNHLRRDVKLINVAGIKGMFYVPVGNVLKDEDLKAHEDNYKKARLTEILWKHNDSGSPLYILHPMGVGVEEKLVTRSNGWVYEVFAGLDEAKNGDACGDREICVGELNIPNESNSDDDPFYLDLISDYYYARASFYMEEGKTTEQGEYLIKAIESDVSPFSSNYNMYIQHRAIWNGQNPELEVKLPPKEVLEN